MRAQRPSDVPDWCADIDTLFLDLDGCIWFGRTPADGAVEAVAALRLSGRRVAFVTNVSSATRSNIAAKLTTMGIPASVDDVQVPVELLPEHRLFAASRATILPFCAAAVRDTLVSLGFDLTDDPREAAVVLVGRDPDMTYEGLARATQAVYGGARVLALNMDSRVPLDDGAIVPGTGAIVAALREATQAPVDVIGKPSRFFFQTALRNFGADPTRTVMVGDTLDTDILGGQRAGLRTVLVGGGDGFTGLDAPPIPDLAVDGVRELPSYFG